MYNNYCNVLFSARDRALDRSSASSGSLKIERNVIPPSVAPQQQRMVVVHKPQANHMPHSVSTPHMSPHPSLPSPSYNSSQNYQQAPSIGYLPPNPRVQHRQPQYPSSPSNLQSPAQPKFFPGQSVQDLAPTTNRPMDSPNATKVCGHCGGFLGKCPKMFD